MKRTVAVLLIISALLAFITSCQKEIDWGTGNAPAVASERLVRIKSKTGTTDTSQVDYSYDAAGRLTAEKTTGVAGGISTDNEFIIYRNGAGVITKTVQKAAALILAGVDSIETKYYYNSSASKYTAAVFSLSVAGIGVLDSTVYTYDGSGRISKDEHYTQVTGSPIPLPPLMSARNNYTYSADGKNLLGTGTDAIMPPVLTLAPVSALTYTTDTKLSPLVILNEAILLNRAGLYSANNPAKSIFTNTADPTQNFNMDYSYIYNSKNKPDSSYATRTPGGNITASKYFYQ